MKPLSRLIAAGLCSLCISTGIAQDTDSAGWTALFNGKNLDGWVQKGGKAKYRVEDGQIVGETVEKTPNSFLCTARDYSDFILEVEFKVDPKLNSGVQIRSRVADQATTEEWNGKTIKFPAGRVHGTQVEIDPSDRGWTGGIYGEGGIGWLDDLKDNEAARKAFKQDDWNKFRVEARGDSIKTWINDVPAAEVKSHVIPSGFIGLQVHSVKNMTKPLEVRFRNIRLKELAKGE